MSELPSSPTPGSGTQVTPAPAAERGPKGRREASKPRRSAVRSTWYLYLLIALAAGIAGSWISWYFLGESLAALGIPDPGVVTTAGLPFLRSASWIASSLAVGSFLLSAFLVPPRRADNLRRARLDVDGSIAARTGALSLLTLAVIGVALVPLYLSDVSGRGIAEAMQPEAWPTAISQVSDSAVWLIVAIIAGLGGIMALPSRSWLTQPVWLFTALLTIVPLGMQGHSASGGDHDYGTNSYLWHLFFAVLWVGGLLALLAHGRRRGTHMDVAVRRYSKIALVSILGMTASGLINAGVRIHPGDWLTTGYGLLITTKAVGLVLLGFIGFIHRRATLPKLADDAQNSGAFRRVALVELLVMAAVIGVAVSLGRTPPPPPIKADINTMDVQLGYQLWKEPTVWNVWTMWRFDIMFGSIALITAGLYLWGVVRARRKGVRWPWFRTAWFMLGSAILLLTMCSGIGLNMPATFSMHMIGHMILAMGVPVAWALGSPGALALEALDEGAPGVPGAREWVEVALDNPVVRYITHPVVNALQFLVFFYILYLTSIYNVAVTEHAGHLIMNFMFIISGYFYFWDLIGVDPRPRHNAPVAKVILLGFSLPFHMYFGVTLMASKEVLAEDFYSTLGLPWHVDLLHDQVVGGGIAWSTGMFPLLVVFGGLFWEWLQQDRSESRRYDAKAERDDDAELEEYNRMLAEMRQGDTLHARYYRGDGE